MSLDSVPLDSACNSKLEAICFVLNHDAINGLKYYSIIFFFIATVAISFSCELNHHIMMSWVYEYRGHPFIATLHLLKDMCPSTSTFAS